MRYLTTDQQFETTLGTIYDCALSPAAWPKALESLAALFNSPFADNYTRNHDRSWEQGVCHGLDAADYQGQLLKSWSKRNVWSSRKPVTVAGEVLSTREILSKQELIRTDMFDAYLNRRGLHEGMRLSTWSGAGGIEVISLLRPFSGGFFCGPELALAERLLPHLSRVAVLSRGVRASGGCTAATAAALDHMHQPVLLLGAAGSVLHANPAALDLLRRADGLQAGRDGLTGATPDATARLVAGLRKAAGAGGAPRASTVRLPRPSGKPSLALIAMPLSRATEWSLSEQAIVMVFVADPSAGVFQPGVHVAAMFGLTPAEAALANELLSGDDLVRIAERSNRSVHTVRTHLARLMSKTGTTRQSELVRMLLAFPSAGRAALDVT